MCLYFFPLPFMESLDSLPEVLSADEIDLAKQVITPGVVLAQPRYLNGDHEPLHTYEQILGRLRRATSQERRQLVVCMARCVETEVKPTLVRDATPRLTWPQ